ncbi:MAG: fumarylacetoacetate hydrolase family protein [Candidatus Bathyarchaeota archaeon]|nr:MAG: fumarylacetoacetate hydrolase family protein [Candidatus Bathyarchaeota archaeon]
MKLTSFKIDNNLKVGLVSQGKIVDLQATYSLMANADFPSDMLSLLESGDVGLKKIKRIEKYLEKCREKRENTSTHTLLYDFNRVEILSPIPRLRKNIICLGLNYIDHAIETNSPIPSNPIFFTKPPTSVIGMNDSIVLPKCSNKIDYEVELAFVFGRTGRNIKEEDAYDYIAGYTILIDITARDLQKKHIQWFKGKSLDTFAPIGPYLVTRDEVVDPHNLDIVMKINGKIMQKSNTKNLIFNIPTIISAISMDMTVEAGDIVATGTPAGVGYTRNPPLFLKPGDIVEASIEGIGTLRNTVTI